MKTTYSTTDIFKWPKLKHGNIKCWHEGGQTWTSIYNCCRNVTALVVGVTILKNNLAVSY